MLKVDEQTADLAITKTSNKTNVVAGDLIEYTMVVTNLGPGESIEITVTDNLPAQVSFVETTANGSYNEASRTVSWSIPRLSAGESLTILLTVMVNAETQGNLQIINNVSVSALTSDPDLSNNTGTSVVDTDFPELFIPNMFSPNADGFNDQFVIRGLQRYPNNSIIILNRWGNKVYEADPYLNDWDGTSLFGPTVGGKDLPIGTYYYILYLQGKDADPIRGFIYLTR